MKTITIFKDFNKVFEQITLEEFLMRIKLCVYANLILPMRQMLRDGNIKGYDNAKRTLPAGTPAGKFLGGRKWQYLVDYISVIVLDFDKLTEDEMIRLKKLINQCIYTLACFVSPSGNGLKVMVCVNSGPEDHLKAFLSVQQFYQTLTGVKIDPSGKDITRLCFVSMDPEIYYNPEAMIFDTSPGASQISISPAIEIPAKPVPNPIPVPETSNINKNYHRCIAHVYQEHNYIEGERHTFVFHLALQLRWSGIAEATTLLLLLKDYNYEEKEVRDCVKSAYSYNWTDGPINAQSKASTTNKKKSHNPATSAFKVRKPKGSKDKPTGDGNTPTSDPPNDPPKEEKKESKKQYELEKVEVLLDYWFDFHYNMVTGTVYWRKKGSKKGFKRLEDRDENTMFCMLHHHNQFIPINTLHILITSLYSRDFDPFVEYFKKLRAWDGVTDYIGQLIATVHTTDDDYWAFCFRKWVVAYVASLVEDAVINHTVIVFVGDQGVGKTSWMKTLVPKSLSKYLGTAALQADSKDTAIMLSECALIILDEMESLNRKDLASFKELITRPEIRIRRPYGRNSENLPRRASFIASVNNQQVLTDTTGSRRYLCSNVISIDYQHDIDIDLVLAQAYALYMSGFCYWFNQDDIKVLTIHNEDFTSMSIEEELILIWLRPVTREEWDSRKMYVNGRNIKLMSSTQIGVFLTEKAKFQLTDNTVIKIGKIMKKHGFKRIRKGNSYAYMVRILDGTVVEQSSQTIDDQDEQKTKLESNDQIINYEDDTSGSNVDGELPF